MRRVLENPDDTTQVFEVIRALSGRDLDRVMQRVRRDPVGRRIVKERRDLVPVLSDSERLLSLPEDTLGNQYARFVAAEQISAAGLADASMTGSEDVLEDVDLETAAFGARLRDMHDLWHVVTGYSRDVRGELALLAFTYEQTRNRGIGYLVRMARRRIEAGGNTEIADFLDEASERGRSAAFLPAADWEALLERSLEEVRNVLRVGKPVDYEQVRTPAGEAAAAAAST